MTKPVVTKNRHSKTRRQDKARTASKHAIAGSNGEGPAAEFSETRSIEELAAEQGIKPTRLDDILGKGADLWDSDQELERFVDDIYARRREDRELAKR